MKNNKRTYELIGLRELFTKVKVAGKDRYIKFYCDRTHPRLGKHNGVYETSDPEEQQAIEADPRFDKRFKRINNIQH